MSLTLTAAAGVTAGLGVAVPMGAMSVLLLTEGLRGWRHAAAGGLAIAAVDLLYATVAVLLGPVVARGLAPVEAWVRLVAAAVLVVIAARGLWSLRRPAAVAEAPPPARSPALTFLRFAGLTLVNPTTALYFVALTTAAGASLTGTAPRLVFVLGVFGASLAWQELLAATAALAGARLPDVARVVSYALGYGVVVAYAGVLAWPLPGA
jgi:arginine exporter protein ArgO